MLSSFAQVASFLLFCPAPSFIFSSYSHLFFICPLSLFLPILPLCPPLLSLLFFLQHSSGAFLWCSLFHSLGPSAVSSAPSTWYVGRAGSLRGKHRIWAWLQVFVLAEQVGRGDGDLDPAPLSPSAEAHPGQLTAFWIRSCFSDFISLVCSLLAILQKSWYHENVTSIPSACLLAV